MSKNAPRDTKNFILLHIADVDFRRLEGDLKQVDLPVRKILERRLRRIDSVYFPDSGFASVVADGSKPIEVGIIGREGMTGLAVVLGDERPQNETFVKVAGKGSRLATNVLRAAMNDSRPLHRVMLRYVHSFVNQTAMTAQSNGSGKIEERLARWLLMADDRIDGGALPLTHDLLAIMLAVRRSGVTVAMQELEHQGLISRARGSVVILDRAGLEKLCHGAYLPI
jgi:CRP-like cAMP-binding protein